MTESVGYKKRLDLNIFLMKMTIGVSWKISSCCKFLLIIRYEMSNCLLEAAIQKAYEKCSCIPSYMFPSNDSCFGDSLNCFKSQMYYLGIRTIFRLIQKS